jgi:putative DNA primase/helicase
MTQHNPITPELLRSALGHVSALLARDEWAKVAMAIKSEYPDETGLDLFDAWSQTAGDVYNAKATRDTWKSVRASGGVTVGTLLHLAKQNGWEAPKGQQQASQPGPEAAARLARERAERAQAEQASIEAAQAHAAQAAADLWTSASDTGNSPYLARKGAAGVGVRYLPDGTLLVPMRDVDGVLWNVQCIAPQKAPDGTDKRYGPPRVKGGRKQGLWHVLGALPLPDAAGAAGALPDAPAVVLLAEGYATAASLHIATGHPVAVAFDAGNLSTVAKALHQLCPGALLVVCGDDDADTEARTGTNPGKQKATAAAKAVKGLALFPEGLPTGASDFNDLHMHMGGEAGLAAVRAIVETGLQDHQAVQTEQAAKGGRAGARHAGTSASGGAQPESAPESAAEWDRFHVTDKGVFHNGVDRDGKPMQPEWVCTRLDVQALTRDQEGQGWGYLLAFTDSAHKPKQWAMPARMLAGDGGEYRAILLGMGLRLSSSSRARNLLTQYIQTRQPDEHATCTDRVGWHGHSFVLPHETIGDDTERIVFQSENAMENTYRVRGTVDAWKERVSALCVGNTRLAFSVACAFAGAVLRPAGMESGGFHFRGDSSSGKTTALKVAASVFGGASYLQRWRTTDNALEAIAAQHCDGLLILDELAQVDPKTAGECAYMLANEQSKARATRGGAPRARLSWRLLFLSAGELGLADHMAEGMKRTRTGQDVRMADIPADAGAGMGAFEALHGLEGGADFARHITGQAGSVYGAVGYAWLQWPDRACRHPETAHPHRCRRTCHANGARLCQRAGSPRGCPLCVGGRCW